MLNYGIKYQVDDENGNISTEIKWFTSRSLFDKFIDEMDDNTCIIKCWASIRLEELK